MDEKVTNYANDNGTRNWNLLEQVLPSDIVELLVPLKAPDDALGDDSVAWLPTTTDSFTIKSAYDACRVISTHHSQCLLSVIWHLEVPQRIRTFHWLC